MTLRNEGGSGRCLFERGGGVYLLGGGHTLQLVQYLMGEL